MPGGVVDEVSDGLFGVMESPAATILGSMAFTTLARRMQNLGLWLLMLGRQNDAQTSLADPAAERHPDHHGQRDVAATSSPNPAPAKHRLRLANLRHHE